MRSSSAHMDYDKLSSPDPLASATTISRDATYSSKRIPSSTTRRQAFAKTPINNTAILPPSSPSRTVTEQTLSPWRIRVTVEAEPEDSEHDGIRTRTTTSTIRIPLKDESSPIRVDTKRKQVRSRAGSNARNERQRSATPMAERRRRQSVTDLDIVVLGDDADEDEWGPRARKTSPRKPRGKKSPSKKGDEDNVQSSRPGFEVRPDTDVEDDGHTIRQEESPELRQLDLNRVSIRPRSNSTKQKLHISSDMTEDTDQGQPTKRPPMMASAARRTVSANSAMTYPTPSPTVSERGQSVEVDGAGTRSHENFEGFDTIMESEGFTMIDLDSLPSVKHMLSSPLDGQTGHLAAQQSSSADSQSTVRRNTPGSTSGTGSMGSRSISAIPPHLVLPEGESEISSTVPSSPPVFESLPRPNRQNQPLAHLQVPAQSRNRQVTPIPYSSPKLPSPPKQLVARDRSTPDSAKAMKAGLVLQGAVEPVPLYPMLSTAQHVSTDEGSHSRSSSDELFDGFDSGTKRELRAGLRFGEELAKRQQSCQASSMPTSTDVWRGETVISRTPVQNLPEQIQRHKDQSPWRIEEQLSKLTTPAARSVKLIDQFNTEASREQEAQLEREAISRQIQKASPSKVIVVDSDVEEGSSETDGQIQDQSIQDVTMEDDEDEDEEDGDIWLEEAKDSSSSPRPGSDDSDLSTQTERHRQRASEVGDKPTEKLALDLLNSGSEPDETNTSTVITNGDDMSGIMWKDQAQDGVQFADAAIKKVRKELRKSGEAGFMAKRASGAFDIEKMIGTPVRIRQSLDRDQTQQGAGRAALQIGPQANNSHEDEYEQNPGTESDISQSSLDSEDVDMVSEQSLQTIPVVFDESSLSQSQQTPPQSLRSRAGPSPSIQRPPTPRSAMKGSRQSSGAANDLDVDLDGAEQAARRVVFAERSRGVNPDWVESSSSLRLSPDEDMSSPVVEHQKHHDARQAMLTSSPYPEAEPEVVGVSDEKEDAEEDSQAQSQDKKGWLGWLWKNKEQIAQDPKLSSASDTQIDGSSSPSQHRFSHEAEPVEIRAPTSQKPAYVSDQSLSITSKSQHPIPSYLLPPSYPSDPTRKPTSPLGTSANFTNTHFRTLHILHRKSQRPRFHAPKLSTCRPELRSLVARKWQLEVDESNAGLGGFAWTLGETEARVLERFCRELEYDFLRNSLCKNEKEVEMLVSEWLGHSGIWSGSVSHGAGRVRWGWDIEELATRLGRIVVGEVVRDEEYGGRESW